MEFRISRIYFTTHKFQLLFCNFILYKQVINTILILQTINFFCLFVDFEFWTEISTLTWRTAFSGAILTLTWNINSYLKYQLIPEGQHFQVQYQLLPEISTLTWRTAFSGAISTLTWNINSYLKDSVFRCNINSYLKYQLLPEGQRFQVQYQLLPEISTLTWRTAFSGAISTLTWNINSYLKDSIFRCSYCIYSIDKVTKGHNTLLFQQPVYHRETHLKYRQTDSHIIW